MKSSSVGVGACRGLLLLLLSVLPLPLVGAGWDIDTPREGVWILRNDRGSWGGWSQGVAHQNDTAYQVRKVFDLSQLPAAAKGTAQAVRLQVYFAIQDYSWSQGAAVANRLDEGFEVVVNGQPQTYQTADPRFAGRAVQGDRLQMAWTDFDLPLAAIQGDRLEVVLRKVLPAGKDKADDYIYPGIDTTVPTTSSFLSRDGGQNWTAEELNLIQAKGEYMIRLLVSSQSLRSQLRWTPAGLVDPDGLAAYLGQEDGALRLEPRAGAWDQNRPLRIRLQPAGHAAPAWRLQEGQGAPLSTLAAGAYELPPDRREVDALLIPDAASLQSLTVEYDVPVAPPAPPQDLCPVVAAPAGRRWSTPARADVDQRQALLQNSCLRARFRFAPSFELESLHAADIDADILAEPALTHLFRIQVGDVVYGCRDGQVREVTPLADGFAVTLAMPPPGLEVVFSARLADDELEFNCLVRNAGVGAEPVRFHLAFPHLAGLRLSEQSADDYYLFPWGGGVIASMDGHLRTAYGENSAWWQMVDLFSPSRGGGVYVRAEDPTALYKTIELRKGVTVRDSCAVDDAGAGFLAPEMLWRTALAGSAGLELCFGYLRRDRAAGASFAAPAVRLGAHAGDWHAAMERYARWSGQTWPRRPFPSRLTGRWTVFATGWNATHSALFKNGAYVEDYLKPRWDIPELMSWWTWSEVGPWDIPMNQLEDVLGSAMYNRYKTYFQNDPGTGRPAYNLNRGDYDGYNPAWGGLPALRAHVQKMKDAGQVPMFYTDPILACSTTKVGREHGPKYGVMNPRWDGAYKCSRTPPGYVGSYLSYNMCLDTEWYSEWVAKTMARVCRETGIDGVRLDEYGHRGYVCESPHHQHLFAEPGHNAWLQALARNCRQVHAAMDEVRPDLVLTTEFPGHDCMSAALDGAIVYDLRRSNALRPVPVNLFRFYFPSCRTFEIDRPHTPGAPSFMLWNATATFSPGPAYPDDVLAMLRRHAAVFDSLDMTPLVPTLQRRVYANRFRHGEETVWTILNGAGHTVQGPVLAVESRPGFEVVDLLSGAELAPVDGAVPLFLRRQECRVIACRPRPAAAP